MPILTQLTSTLLPPLLTLTQTLLPPLMQIVSAVLPPTASLLSTILPVVTTIASAVLPTLVGVIANLLPLITPLLDVAMQIVDTVILPLLPPLMQIVEALLPPVVSLLSTILPLLNPILLLLQPIADVLGVIVGVVSQLVSFGGGIINTIAGLFGGGGSTSTPDGFATGGFTRGISIAGEDPRYPTEAVISFNPAYRSANLAYWAKAGEMLGLSGNDVVVKMLPMMDGNITGYAAGGFTNADSLGDISVAYGRNFADSARYARAIAEEDNSGNYEPLSVGTGSAVVYDLTGLTFAPQIKTEGDIDADELIRMLRDLEPEFIDFILEALARREDGAYVTADDRLY